MKIERIESFLIGGGYVVRLTTDSGLTGVGQTACWGYPEAVQSIVSAFERYLVGQDPLRIEHHCSTSTACRPSGARPWPGR